MIERTADTSPPHSHRDSLAHTASCYASHSPPRDHSVPSITRALARSHVLDSLSFASSMSGSGSDQHESDELQAQAAEATTPAAPRKKKSAAVITAEEEAADEYKGETRDARSESGAAIAIRVSRVCADSALVHSLTHYLSAFLFALHFLHHLAAAQRRI